MRIRLKRVNLFRWEKTWSIEINCEFATKADLESVSDLLSVELDSIVLFDEESFAFLYTTPLGFSYKKVKAWIKEAAEDCVPVLPNEVRPDASWTSVTNMLWDIKQSLE